MRTTMLIPDPVMKRIRLEAARRGTTLTALVEAALRAYLDAPAAASAPLPPLPTWDGGPLLVDIADRDALYRVMEEQDGGPLLARERGPALPRRTKRGR